MNYHNITMDDMLNGSGLRVCLWCSGCEHHCASCQNSQTWDSGSGIVFNKEAEDELFEKLSETYISGITFTGGDPLHKKNLKTVLKLCKKIRYEYKDIKSIWIYSGYTWEDIWENKTDKEQKKDIMREILEFCDVFVDGRFDKDKADVNYAWAGSTNQRVIDVKKTLSEGKIILWEQS